MVFKILKRSIVHMSLLGLDTAGTWVDALCLPGCSTITWRWKHMFLLNISINVKPQTYVVWNSVWLIP